MGWLAEMAAVIVLTCKGYRVLARRYKTHAGEVDIVAVRRNRLVFVEVKYRRSRLDAEASITPNLRRRTRQAAQLWLAKAPRYQSHDVGFDLIFLHPWRWPQHLENAL